MAVARRDVLRGAAATGIMTTIPSMLVAASTPPSAAPPPISRVEREGRLLRLQAELRRRNLAALLVEAGSSLVYFTGIDWWRDRRRS